MRTSRHNWRPRLLSAFSGGVWRGLSGYWQRYPQSVFDHLSPTNDKLDGTYRKLKVQVVAPDGGPLKVKDQKGKDQKIEVVAATDTRQAFGGLDRVLRALTGACGGYIV